MRNKLPAQIHANSRNINSSDVEIVDLKRTRFHQATSRLAHLEKTPRYYPENQKRQGYASHSS